MKLLKGAYTFELVIPENVEDKIRHLCSQIHDVEWSGTLFYETEGSFDDGTFKARCLDICVMDVGTGGFTEFTDNPDIVSYRIDHPELLREGVYEGLIHSHNVMSAFFSGTDVDTLKEEGIDHNHFLSLIVNNAGSYVARITRKIVKESTIKAHIECTENSYYNTYENHKIALDENKRTESVKEDTVRNTTVEWFEMNIDKKSVTHPYDELDSRIRQIMKNKKESRNFYKAPFQGTYEGNRKVFDSYKRWPEEYYWENPYKDIKIDDDFSSFGKPKAEESDPKEVLEAFKLIPQEEIDRIVAQLLSSSILINPDKLDLKSWVSRIDSLYEKRFGNLLNETNMKMLEDWVEKLIEFMLNWCISPDVEKELERRYSLNAEIDGPEIWELYTIRILKELKKMPKSIVIDAMIDELELYVTSNGKKYL